MFWLLNYFLFWLFQTFGEILKPERGRGVMRPHRGGGSGGPYRGRGFGTAGSGHPINYWNPVAKN